MSKNFKSSLDKSNTYKYDLNNYNIFMNLFFFSKNFIKQVSLVGVAAWIGYPQIVNAEGMVVESGTMGAIQQSVEAKGVVYDATGFPVIGASVVEKGNSTNGVITDLDGNFTLQVAKNAVIVISYMGYQTQEVQVTPGKILNITLKEDNQVLDEVVVVGYGVQKKVNLTGSVATVEGETAGTASAGKCYPELAGYGAGLVHRQYQCRSSGCNLFVAVAWSGKPVG